MNTIILSVLLTVTLSFTNENYTDNSCFTNFIENEFVEEPTVQENIKSIFTSEFEYKMLNCCLEENINPWIVLSLLYEESRYDSNAKAYDGSKHYGLGQLSVFYFKDYVEALTGNKLDKDYQDFFDPIINMEASIFVLTDFYIEAKNYNCVKNSILEDPLITIAILAYHNGMSSAIDSMYNNTLDAYTINILNRAKDWEDKYGSIDIKTRIDDLYEKNIKENNNGKRILYNNSSNLS